MNERYSRMYITDGEVGVTLGDNFQYFYTDFDMTIVFVSCAPSADDGDGSIDINDDGSGVITAVGCTDADVPGTWKSTHIQGGTNTPVTIAAGSKVSLDANGLASGVRVTVLIGYLVGEISA